MCWRVSSPHRNTPSVLLQIAERLDRGRVLQGISSGPKLHATSHMTSASEQLAPIHSLGGSSVWDSIKAQNSSAACKFPDKPSPAKAGPDELLLPPTRDTTCLRIASSCRRGLQMPAQISLLQYPQLSSFEHMDAKLLHQSGTHVWG